MIHQTQENDNRSEAIFPAMVRVMRSVASEGISKSRKNTAQGYSFRGIDEVMNTFAPMLAKEGILIIPSFSGRVAELRETKGGGTQEFVTLEGSFRFVAEDGSGVTVGPIYGESADSGDKATNKAMAVAFKYAIFQAFCVPLEGITGGDADSAHPEMASRPRPVAAAPPAPRSQPQPSEPEPQEPDDSHEPLFGASSIPAARWDAIGELWHEKGVISEAQRKRIYAIAKGNGWTSDQVDAALLSGLTEGATKIPWGKPYDAICALFGEFRP
jgi:hypothetical protein